MASPSSSAVQSAFFSAEKSVSPPLEKKNASSETAAPIR